MQPLCYYCVILIHRLIKPDGALRGLQVICVTSEDYQHDEDVMRVLQVSSYPYSLRTRNVPCNTTVLCRAHALCNVNGMA